MKAWEKVSIATQDLAPVLKEPGYPESRAAREIRRIFESGRPLIYIRSGEEQRVGRLLREVGQRLFGSQEIWTWSLTEGLHRDQEAAVTDTQDARKALDFVAGYKGGAIFHLKDFHEPLRESAEVRRRLRDVYECCQGSHQFIVITSPVAFLPPEIERTTMFLDLRPPDRTELMEVLREEAADRIKDEAMLAQIAGTLLGLTLDEARFAMRRALNEASSGELSLAALLEEKRLLVSRGGMIEYIGDPTDIGAIGGLEGLKRWLLERRDLFQMRDTLSAEIVPKGVLMMGIPGCGKSLSVKAIASAFQIPLYRIDMIEIFSGRHGKPEGAFVEACRTMEDMAPAVLWFDEIEMGVTSAESGGEQGRIFAFFLTWMQEKARGLFVAATANRIDLLPAEMIRKGRFDEVFFVDLPLEQERIEIFKIHLERRGVSADGFDLGKLLQFTNGWAGAEIEQCVIAAITKARLEQRELSEDDLIHAAVKIVPLSRTMSEQINHIRSWAFERAVRASPQAR